ncbi:phage holin, LL-H family [Streptococcus pneumoniae]|nr:phage holin, LL-H family [Streptococcus pneumoniae]
MQQITEIITNGAISILVVLAGVVVRAVKDYLVQKGGEKTIKIVEILAKNAVNAVEQVAAETGYKGDEKLAQARAKVRAELTKYNISMTDKDLDTFVESVWAFNQWGGTIATINVAVLLNHEFYIMKFDAEGNPDWTDPTGEPKE